MKIAEIQVFPVIYPTAGRFKFLEDPTGKRTGRAAVLIKITADDGTAGWGESVPIPKWTYETIESVTHTIRHYFTPAIRGMDPFDLHSIHEVMNQLIRPGFTTGMPIAKAGVDIALHDLCGKALGAPLSRLWGRRSGGELTLSWTLNPATMNDLDRMIDEGLARGFQNFNVKVAPDLKVDIELCSRVKARIPDGFLWADANCGYDLASALKAAPKLADSGVDVLEAPLPPHQISGYKRLRQQGALPILMDEGIISPVDLMELIRLDALDGVAMKPARCGGLTSARRQIELLQDAGLMFLGSGLTDPDVSLSASLALYHAYGLNKPAALNGPQFLSHSVLKTPFQIANGVISLPQGPGLGIVVDEEKIREISVELKI
ncbi:MAG: mandelate racemase/muconate lactonizing enzyme family protein [bacterium]|jgi:muconate cycloisomerase